MERYLIQLCDTIVRLIQKHAVAEAPLWRPPEPVVEEPIVEPKPIPVQASVIERVAAAEPSMNSEPIKERTTSSPRIPSEETGKRAEPVTEGVKAAPKPTVEPTPETVDLRTAEAEIEESKSGWRRLPGWAWGVLAVVISVAVMAAWQLFGPPFFSPKMNHDARLYDQACGGGDAGACDDLGNLYMGHNHSKSAAFFTKACDGGDALGCSSLGDLYLDGVGVAQDSHKAITLFSKACDGGNVNGCNVAGYIYRIGLGVAKDPEKERQFLTTGCKIGVQSSCDQLKEMQ
jgi:hypothetical protein